MHDERRVADSQGPQPGGQSPAWGAPRTRTLEWFSPELSSVLPQDISGLDYLQAVIDGRLPPPPIAAVTAMTLVAAEAGSVTLRCVPDESWLNPNRSVHGGLLCTLMDSAMGMSVLSARSLREPYTSIELKVSFIKPLPWDGQAVEARGRVLRIGRKVAFAEAHAHSADGVLVGHATSSLAAVSAN